MIRRSFLAMSACAALALATPAFAAKDSIEYMPGDIKADLAKGKTLFVDYYASWCGVCKRQGRVLDKLRSKNPAYDKAMTFYKIDWDVYAKHDVSTSRNIPRRSTLLVLKGDKELGRIVAGTDENEIRALLDKGL